MKIALFHHCRAGGSKRALYEYARCLAARGHQLEAFTLASADEAFLPLAEVVEQVHVEPVTLPEPITTRWLPLALQYWNLQRRLAALDALDAAQARVAAKIDAGGFDLAFVHPDFVTASPYVLKHLKTPSAYFCQEPLRRYHEPDWHSEAFAGPPPVLGWKDRVRKAWYAPIEPTFERRHKADDIANARAADLILANSDYSREAIFKAYGRFARVARLGVDSAHFHPTGGAQAHAVISVGRFQSKKCQELLIEAVARLPEPERPLVILVGESTGVAAYRDYLTQLAAARGVVLEVHEHVSDAVLLAQYNRAKLAVFTPIMEPFGFVPLEAAACGVPTVGVREAGVRETVRHGETGLLVERDAQAVAEAIAELLQDDARRERMGRSARADVQANWTWARGAEILEARFAELLASACGARKEPASARARVGV